VEETIELARRLGKAIASSPEAGRLRQARKAMNDEPGLSQLLDEFGRQSGKVAELEADNKPIEVSDKRRLQELNDKLISNAVFKKYTAAQVDYVDLMRKVNEALQGQLSAIEEQAGQGRA
jgi:cell fate (sporulation/competence/biofilm development) regulator YlbF (YheA/YmcA/DUF963 family)